MATCRFLENLTFGCLIAPVTEDEFRSRYWELRPLVVHRKDPDYYGDLCTLDDFDDAVARSSSYVKTLDAAGPRGTIRNFATVRGLEAVLADMRDGGSLILEQVQRHDPKLGLFCRMLGQELGHGFEANLYMTPPYGKSSIPHWDNTDVFIMQVLGSKEWRIEKERRVFPIRPHRMGPDGREFRGEVETFTVQQGDIVYIPRGFMHIAECGPEASLHISLGIVPVVLEEFLHAAVKAAVQYNEGLRVSLPLGFMQGSGERIVNQAIAALRGTADKDFLRAVLDQFRDECVRAAPLDISGQVADFFRATPLAVEDMVGPRRGVVYQVHVGDGAVRLNVGTRSIVFPGLFREALGFALSTPAFAIRDITGGLEDDEKIVFIERLMQEGLVVRK